MPRISLCMIARNEAEMLPGCLASVVGVVDEIILVDTGSTDATKEIAERAGATVIDAPWNDDFSAPRNVAIAHASGDWILQLDPDERLAPGSGKRLRRALRKARFDCGLVRLHNAVREDSPACRVISGAERLGGPTLLPRVLRRADDLEYRGVIHESVEDWVVARGRKLEPLNIDLIHLGQTEEIRRAREKSNRNMNLLRRRCELEPDNVAPFGYLAMELVFADQFDEALTVAEQGWALVGSQPPHRSVLRLCIARARLLLSGGAFEAVLECAEVAERTDGVHPDIAFLRGCAYEAMGRSVASGEERREHLNAARSDFGKALSLHNTATAGQFVAGGTTWAAWNRLGTVELLSHRYEKAEEAFEKALLHDPDNVEARLGHIEAAIGREKYTIALKNIESCLDHRPDAWLLAARAAEGLKSVADMQMFFGVARERATVGYLAPHRIAMHRDVGLLVLLASGHPQGAAGGIGTLCGILAGAPSTDGAVPPTPTDIERVVAIAENSGQKERLERLLSPDLREYLAEGLESLPSLLEPSTPVSESA